MTIVDVTQSTNSIQSSLHGLTFLFDDEIVTVRQGVSLLSTGNSGVFSDHPGSTLINFGSVASTFSDGVDILENDSSILNGAAGSISGQGDGVSIYGAGRHTIDNYGVITGITDDGVLFGAGVESHTLNNRGVIFGGANGVYDESEYGGALIINSGKILSAGTAVSVATAAGLTTAIVNTAGATIDGQSEAIHAHSGLFTIDNAGTIIGNIVDKAGAADVVTNHGFIQDSVHLGGGNDTFVGSGGTSGSIFGEAGNDHLVGGSYVDLLYGGAGRDTLTGGGGADHFFFDSKLNAVTNVDHITDFAAGIDKIGLSKADFSGLGSAVFSPLAASHFHVGAHATTAAQHILYNAANGWLSYDADGKGAGATIHFATLTPHLTLHAGDFLVMP